ncbi:hypothetical protein [Streptomyces canus]|nr:hypothetical protein [Streptomyces canus]
MLVSMGEGPHSAPRPSQTPPVTVQAPVPPGDAARDAPTGS